MNKLDTITLHVGHVVKIEVTPTIERVIQIAKQARASGETKVAAVRQVYPMIADLPVGRSGTPSFMASIFQVGEQ